MYFVGIDISKNSFHYYVSDSDRTKIFSASALVVFVGRSSFAVRLSPRTEESGQMKKGWVHQ
ncbi:hypothetical protein X925_03270 [Petrotoga sp. 9T1HF07.CasAA.8.2]|uniref:hypothetical protein n=1 Tax=Petrotoga sp. 9T1HF07.CasAA.8.2 TaxID=1434329 RepID=UPI000CCB5ABF|nr:hypothetical protein [Petrotoga sp. 9T1HF07.CasAA.8.2]PNR89317.1 hypothetical protein X925_03270 [Petrotoga sp. 9T1HF07.CasAA.8.2]